MAGRVRHSHAWALVESKNNFIESVHYSRRSARSRKSSLAKDGLKVVKLVPETVVSQAN